MANNYSSQDLFLAEDLHQRLADFVSRATGDGKPFARQVDAWWLAIGVGIKIGHRTPLPETTVKFNDAGILSSDPWRIVQLELLAIATDGEAVLESPAQVVRIASEYANTGLRWILDAVLGQAEPSLTLLSRLPECGS
ncbi:MAG: hypothetical protein IT383_24820 [Deltaproteobacteria bacterium]|nr:hypothetical protein [Deltaproteobacteria bacterium]